MIELFEMIGTNSQKKSVRSNTRRGAVHKATEMSSLAQQMEKMQSDMQKLLRGSNMSQQHQKRAQCNMCGEYGHVQNQCQMHEDEIDEYEQVHWMNSQYNSNNQGNQFKGNQRQGGGVYSNTYNRKWRNHPNLSWSNNNALNPSPQQQQQGFQNNYNQQHIGFNQQKLLGNSQQQRLAEDPMQEILQKMEAMQNEMAKERESTGNTIRRLEMQLGQVANEVQGNRHGKFPSQPELAKSIHVLRSGKKVNNGISYNEDEDDVDTNMII